MSDSAAGPGLREGGPDVFKRGSLKRRLPIKTICELSQSLEGGADTVQTVRLLLKNLNADLKCHIMAGFASNKGSVPIRPSSIAAGTATMQLTPKAIPGDSNPIWLRPVFQDPALAQHENHPLAQNIPIGWEFSTNADEVEIEVIVNFALLAGTNLNGKLLVMADIQYDGVWWDTKAMQYAISQVQLTGSDTSFGIFTGGG